MRLWLRWSACLCLSLICWTAAAESTHHHPDLTESGSCVLCVVAHTASPAPNSTDSTPAFTTVGLWHEKTVVANVRLYFSDLTNRGPPAL